MVDNAVINERGGAKADAGKTRYDLLVPEFIEGMANVMTFGTTKYSDWNWVNLERNRLIASLWRHIIEYQQEKMFDKETNFSHLYHAACNLMMLDYLDSPEKPEEKSIDEKPEKGTSSSNKLHNTYICVRGVLRYITMTSEEPNESLFKSINLDPLIGNFILEDTEFKYWGKYDFDALKSIFKSIMEYLEHGRQENKVEYHKGLYRAFQNRMRQMHSQHGMSLNDLAEHVEIDRDTLYTMMQDIYDEHYRFYTAQQYAEKLSFTYQTDSE